MPEKKPMQVRRTLEDVIKFQNDLLQIVRTKRQNNSCLSFSERDTFLSLFTKSVLSQGSIKCLYRTRKGTIVPFHHLTELAYLLSEQTTNYVNIINDDTKGIYENNIPISELWKFFERKLIYVFPYACDEASHMSAEAVIHESPTSFNFSAQKQEMQ
jgi:hypothetical protein